MPDHALPSIPLAELPGRLGEVLGTSPWLTIDQARIDAFARATEDLQWIHTDPARAAAGPFGTTIAHGFLTLSLLSWMGEHAFEIPHLRMSINYGLNRVRFPAPLPVGSRVRGVFRLLACEQIDGGSQVTVEATVEREGSTRPVCVAESVSRRYS
ncbi:MaoC family dehydratase [Sphaerotilus montanus]|uniref:Acyl dehydratase n=1 Tax=Sphaerotilus montanus TaxID=522889 RepID=A0A7Y9QXN0_9BURK|nr:MaoC family dehydratase [Sphaerotilus montanus]NYG32509.1 acyl dehydratase [Sphaerotilus montanus]NZD56296.1 MaoC family dehydratase [Sphaerotilus montanus]